MKTDRKSRTARKAPFLTSLALACALMTGSAGAGIPVTDVGNMPNHIITQIQSYLNQLNTYTQKLQDATQYAREIQHMTQQLTSLDQMFASLGLTFTSIEEKSASELNAAITQRCNSSGGGFNPLMFVTEMLNLNGDVIAQQKTKCVQIVSLQFMQYNEQVRMLKKLQRAQADIQRLNSQLASANTNGKMDSNIGTAQGIMTQLQADTQYTETVIRTYEGMIKMVEEDQRQLARQAFQGKSSILGTMISTATLAGALEIAD
jgi:L-lactate utilization protein LutC